MSPSLALIGIYMVLTALLQFVGFLISQVVSTISPPLSLMTFLAWISTERNPANIPFR